MPYNNPIKKKDSACKQLKSETGKPSGLMMEGSVAYQESVEQEKKDLMKDMPVDDKASALEMSPYKMSPLNDNHPKIDPKTGKRVVQPFIDPGPDPSQGFTDDSRPYDLTSEGGGKGQYDEEAMSKRFFTAQDQVQNALDLAQRQLSGEEVFHSMVPGMGSTAATGPQAAQVITGYSAGLEGEEPKVFGGSGKVRFSKQAVQDEIDRLNQMAIEDPVAARSHISKRLQYGTSRLGSSFGNRFKKYVDPLKRN